MKCKCKCSSGQSDALTVSHSRKMTASEMLLWTWAAACLSMGASCSSWDSVSLITLFRLLIKQVCPQLAAHLSHNTHFVKSETWKAQFDRLLWLRSSWHADMCCLSCDKVTVHLIEKGALMQVVPNRCLTCSKRANLSLARRNQSMMPIIVTTTCGALSLQFTASLTIWLMVSECMHSVSLRFVKKLLVKITVLTT